jgi:hypothetical protein
MLNGGSIFTKLAHGLLSNLPYVGPAMKAAKMGCNLINNKSPFCNFVRGSALMDGDGEGDGMSGYGEGEGEGEGGTFLGGAKRKPKCKEGKVRRKVSRCVKSKSKTKSKSKPKKKAKGGALLSFNDLQDLM